MAFGDPANAGANHGSVGLGTTASGIASPSFATTAGNTLVISVRSGLAAAPIAVSVSENAGASFSAATLADATHAGTSSGILNLWTFLEAGTTAGNVQIKVTQTSATLRLNWCEYTGNFSYSSGKFTDGGASTSTAVNSGTLTTSGTSTLIGFFICGRNNSNDNSYTPGTTNSLTWTARDTLIETNNITCALMDFNAGGQAAGTYADLATLGVADNWAAEIFSFVPAGGASPHIGATATFAGQSSTPKALVEVGTSPTITAQSGRRAGYF